MKGRWLELRRWRELRRDVQEPLRTLLGHKSPSQNTAFTETEFLALDIETTGLDATTAQMLSVGWVVIRNGKVDLGTADTYIVRPEGEVGHSASVHGLTDTMVEAGRDRFIVLSKVVEALTGRVLVVHHAGLDKALLDRMCRMHFGAPLLVPVVDTLALEHRRQSRRHHVDERRSLRLSDLRDEYRLPRYAAHDCLVDAIATAELLIAMVAHSDGADATCLCDL